MKIMNENCCVKAALSDHFRGTKRRWPKTLFDSECSPAVRQRQSEINQRIPTVSPLSLSLSSPVSLSINYLHLALLFRMFSFQIFQIINIS